MAQEFYKTNLGDEWATVVGPARILVAPEDEAFPITIGDIIDYENFFSEGNWLDLGATLEGINISLTDLDEKTVLDLDGDITQVATQKECTVTTNLAENTLEHVQLALDGSNIEDVYKPIFRPYAEYIVDEFDPSLHFTLGNVDGLENQASGASGVDGTAEGGVEIGTASGIWGNGSYATDFHTTGEYISTPYEPFVNGVTRTFVGWTYRDTNTTDHYLVSGNAVSGFPYLRINATSNNVVWRPDNTTGTTTTWTDAWPGTLQWVHWALCFNEASNEATLWINGELISTETNTSTYSGSPGTFEIGRADYRMAHVSVFERTLVQEDISKMYTAGLTPNNPELIEYVLTNERSLGIGFSNRPAKRKVAILFRHKHTGLIRAFVFRRASIRVDNAAFRFQKGGPQHTLPITFFAESDQNIADIKKRLFVILEQHS